MLEALELRHDDFQRRAVGRQDQEHVQREAREALPVALEHKDVPRARDELVRPRVARVVRERRLEPGRERRDLDACADVVEVRREFGPRRREQRRERVGPAPHLREAARVEAPEHAVARQETRQDAKRVRAAVVARPAALREGPQNHRGHVVHALAVADVGPPRGDRQEDSSQLASVDDASEQARRRSRNVQVHGLGPLARLARRRVGRVRLAQIRARRPRPEPRGREP
mmetsp:Transcript_31422/g.94310  ORF Transcript_31422/g.94310 Transcript_31422/m.94310 type:complete len:229 (+) Transcript_31422:150-836(+)